MSPVHPPVPGLSDLFSILSGDLRSVMAESSDGPLIRYCRKAKIPVKVYPVCFRKKKKAQKVVSSKKILYSHDTSTEESEGSTEDDDDDDDEPTQKPNTFEERKMCQNNPPFVRPCLTREK